MKNWSVGVMEYWSNEKETGGMAVTVLQYSKTPVLQYSGPSILQYSNTPIF
jgi:hypothetical protein